MFSLELKVNSQLLAHIYGRNIEETGSGIFKYSYRYYEPESGKVFEGEIVHKRASGLRKLILGILKDIEREDK